MVKYSRIAGGYEVNNKTGKIRATDKYGKFGKTHAEDLLDQAIDDQIYINNIEDDYEFGENDSLMEAREEIKPTVNDVKKVMKGEDANMVAISVIDRAYKKYFHESVL